MITIIIPIYGVEAYIEECLSSVAAQTYAGPMECVLVDDCSPDRSIERAQDFIGRYEGPVEFRVVHRESNGGLSAARNTGQSVARGEWLFFLDSDDTLPPGAIAALAAAAESSAGVQMAVGDFSTFGDEDAPNSCVIRNMHALTFGRSDTRACLLDESIMSHSAWGKLIRRSALGSLGFREGMLCEDMEWFFFLSLSLERVAVCHESVYNYRVRGGSIMTDKSKSYMRSNDILLSLLRCSSKVEGEASDVQIRWILSHIIDFDTELRWASGDCRVRDNRLLRAMWAVIRRMRKRARGAALRISLGILVFEFGSGLRLRNRLFMPVHRAAKMFYKMSRK